MLALQLLFQLVHSASTTEENSKTQNSLGRTFG
jgi:hypothetical protein